MSLAHERKVAMDDGCHVSYIVTSDPVPVATAWQNSMSKESILSNFLLLLTKTLQYFTLFTFPNPDFLLQFVSFSSPDKNKRKTSIKFLFILTGLASSAVFFSSLFSVFFFG